MFVLFVDSCGPASPETTRHVVHVETLPDLQLGRDLSRKSS